MVVQVLLRRNDAGRLTRRSKRLKTMGKPGHDFVDAPSDTAGSYTSHSDTVPPLHFQLPLFRLISDCTSADFDARRLLTPYGTASTTLI